MPKLNFAAMLLGLIACALIAPLRFSIADIPFILHTLALFSVAAVLGKWQGSIVALVYLLLGALGLPVFAGYQSGWEKLLGPTAGFLWAFPVVCFYLGWACKKGEQSFFHYMVYFFRAHLMWLVPGIVVLYFSYEGMDLLGTLVKLFPDILLKSAVGGILTFGILQRFPNLDRIRG